MRPRPRRGPAQDDGFTLVEMLVAILVLAIALTVMARVLGLSLRTQLAQDRQTSGSQVATSEMEKLQALPWRSLGFYTSDSPPAPPSGRTYPSLGATRPSGDRAPLPTGTATTGGTPYTIARSVLWYDNLATNTSNDYKQLSITVSWTDPKDTARTFTTNSIRSPKGSEQTPADFSIRKFDASPYGAGLDGAGSTQGRLNQSVVLTMSTTAASSSAGVAFTDRSGTAQSLTMTQNGDALHWTVTVNSGAYSFPNGDNVFTFSALRVSPASTVTAGKVTRLLEPFTPSTPSASPSTVCASAASTTAVGVVVYVQGATVDDAVTVQVGSAGASATAAWQSSDTNGSTFATTLPAGAITTTSQVVATATRSTPTQGSSPTTTVIVNVASC